MKKTINFIFVTLFFLLHSPFAHSIIKNSVIISVGNLPITQLDLVKEMRLISVLTKYVGSQYMGNIDSKLSKLSSYSTSDINLTYQPNNFPFFENIKFTMLINNIFGLKYISNGYFYTFDDNYSLPGTIKTIEGVGYYPQAERNFLIGINTRF